MKKLLLLIASLSVISAANAQYKTSPLQFSLLGSGGVGWMHTDAEYIGAGPVRIGGSMEAHVDYQFLPNFAFSAGVQWGSLSVHTELSRELPYFFLSGPVTIPEGSSLIYNIQYLEIPVGLKITSREIGYSTFFMDYGVMPMFRLKAEAGTSDKTIEKESAIKEVTRFNVGYFFDMGIKYSFGNSTCLIVSVFYKNTFLDFTTDVSKPVDHSRINQAGIRLGFGF